MTIFINNKSFDLPDNTNLSDALKTAGINSFQGIAVAVNNHIIPKTSWEDHAIGENDALTIIRATQGG